MRDQRLWTGVGAGFLLVAGVLGVAACDSDTPRPVASGATAGGPSGSAPSGPASATPPAGGTSGVGDAPTPTSAGSGGAAGGSGECRLDELKVTAGQGDGAAGHWGFPLLFRNAGTRDCYLIGYPGVAGLDANGKQATQAKRTPNGYLGGLGGSTAEPSRVPLAPGGTASALLEGTNVPRGDARSCPRYAGLLVTPPDETHSVRLTVATNGCGGLEIHPVVPGATGRPSED